MYTYIMLAACQEIVPHVRNQTLARNVTLWGSEGSPCRVSRAKFGSHVKRGLSAMTVLACQLCWFWQPCQRVMSALAAMPTVSCRACQPY